MKLAVDVYYTGNKAKVVGVLFENFSDEKPLKAKFNQHESEVKDDFLNESGEGEIREGMVYFKGTLWRYDGDLAEGSKVRVRGTKGNKVVLERD